MTEKGDMRLGVLPEQGGCFANMRRTGQDTRFIEQYLKVYAREFEEVFYFSYARETMEETVANNFHFYANPGFHRWLYSFLMPVIHASRFRRCSVLRVLAATGAISARIGRLLFGVPFVITYGYHYAEEARRKGHRFRAWLFERRARWALRRADGIIVTTPALGEFVRSVAPSGRVALIPNSVNTDLFAPAPEAPSQRPSRRRLIAVGNLTPVKNHRLLVEAVAATGRRDVEVVILGAGPEEQALRRLAAEKGVALDLPGTVPNDQLPDWLRRADVYLITSLSEGHPKSLLEAMSVGLPCIGTEVKGIRDVLIAGKTGWLCPSESGALAATIQAIFSDQELARAVGANARCFILDNYDLRVVMAREVAFLKEVAWGSQRSPSRL
jgi:glycosyltransferase involved in cell wall biosynthesis